MPIDRLLVPREFEVEDEDETPSPGPPREPDPPKIPVVRPERNYMVDETGVLRARHQLLVFWLLVQVLAATSLIFLALAMFRPLASDRFGGLVLGPLMTILAGAVGFYFGNQRSDSTPK
jgi:hypothetical protein